MQPLIKRLAVAFGLLLASIATAHAVPILNYVESFTGTQYIYDFTLKNDDAAIIDELYIEFELEDPSGGDFYVADSPNEWISFAYQMQPGELNPANNYFVGWTANIGSELQAGMTLTGFSITLFNAISAVDFSWNWDRYNVGSAAPVPEPATILLMASGLIGLLGFRRKQRCA